MAFFTVEAAQKLGDDAIALKTAREELTSLHKLIYEQIRLNHFELNLVAPEASPTQRNTVAELDTKNVLSVAYLRTRGQAAQIERLMGREEVASIHTVEARRHPVIEIRLSPTHFAIELILSPDAWVDQENLAGKLTVLRHRQEFYSLLQSFQLETVMGFWQGIHLSEMHLSAKHFRHPRIMDEWMSTFHPSADCLRLGRWYPLEEAELSLDAVMTQLRSLYSVYQFILWTSDNNFREFYHATR